MVGARILQVHQLNTKLVSVELQLQLAAEARADAEAEVATLQASLLQQTAIAEAARGQLAAAAITQQVQAMLVPHAALHPQPKGNAAVAAVEPATLCADPAYAMQRQLAASPLPAGDAKAQRIQELRAALAAALSDASSAACNMQGLEPASSLSAGPARGIGAAAALADDPKVRRLHEVVGALMSAAAQLPTASSAQQDPSTADAPANGSSNSSSGDAKQQRIQELRAALSDALRERDELRQQLQAGPASANSTLLQAEQQLQEVQLQLVAAQVGACLVPSSCIWRIMQDASVQ